MPVIEFEHVSKTYRLGTGRTGLREALPRITRKLFSRNGARSDHQLFWALDDVSFSVEQGEVLGIIGHNGAGKSTILKLLSKVSFPTSGRIRTQGRMAALIELGAGFHPDLSGRENIYLNGAILGLKRQEIDEQFSNIVEFAELEQFIDTPIKRYSSGMYVRLAFAVAAHVRADILLVDEVLSVGDMAFQKKSLAKMNELRDSGVTIAFISHNLAAVQSFCQRVLLLESGRTVADGDPKDVVYLYSKNEALAQLNAFKSSTGWADLSSVERNPSLTGQKARFMWARILDAAGRQTGTESEGRPITIELGFQVMERIRELRFGCSVEAVEGQVELFTVPSPAFTDVFEPGNYSVRLEINPNHLRKGDYVLALKMFADHERQETIAHAIGLSIHPRLSAGDNPAYLQKWVAGYLRFDYEWGPIENENLPSADLSLPQEIGRVELEQSRKA